MKKKRKKEKEMRSQNVCSELIYHLKEHSNARECLFLMNMNFAHLTLHEDNVFHLKVASYLKVALGT
jgi:hypothetical protein